jgi:hypothetical protein
VRRHGRVDANQPQIVKALRAVGASVQSLADMGRGVPDLLVGWQGVNLLMEVKDGAKPPSARRLTPDEKLWHERWNGDVSVVDSVDEALRRLRDVNQSEREASSAPGRMSCGSEADRSAGGCTASQDQWLAFEQKQAGPTAPA